MKKLCTLIALLGALWPALAQVTHFAHFSAGYDSGNNCVAFIPFHGKCYIKLDRYDTLLVADAGGGISQSIPSVRALWGTAGQHLITMLPVEPIVLRSIDAITGRIDTIPIPDSLASTFVEAKPVGQDAHQLFFQISTGSAWHIWRTDGTLAGTWQVFTCTPGSLTQPLLLGMAGSAFYFFYHQNGRTQLWRTDGAPAGPLYTFDSAVYTLNQYQGQYRYDGSHLFFFMTDGLYRLTLSTEVAERFWQDIPSTYGTQLFLPVASGRFIFRGLTRYYTTDGTTAGTRPFYVPLDSADQQDIYYTPPVTLGQGPVFAGSFSRYGMECYTATGDSAHLILDANKGMADFTTYDALSASFDGHLYLTGDDGRTGRELWRTDGTPTGYEQLADLTPGPDGTRFLFMSIADSSLYTIAARPGHIFDIYRIDRGATAPYSWRSVPDRLQDEWTELVTPGQSYDGQLISEDMATQGSDIYFALHNWQAKMQFRNNNIDIKGGPIDIVKMDRYSRLQWVATMDNNEENSFEDYPKGISADQKGCTIVGNAWQRVTIGTDTVAAPYALSYIAHFSADSGKLTWFWTFNDTRYANDFPWITTTDASGNIYVGTNYETGTFHCQGWTLTSPLSPTNVMLKFDDHGHTIWARNLLTPWLDRWGVFSKMVVDERHQRIYALITQSQYHTASTCAYDSSKFYIACMDTSGTLIWSQNIIADDLATGMTLDIDTDIGELVIQGKFRGHMLLGAHTLSSYESEGCTAFLPYFLRMSATDGHILSAAAALLPADQYPYRTLTAGGYLYTLATSDHDSVAYATDYMPDGKCRTTIYRSTMTGLLLDSVTFLRNGTMNYDDFSFTPFLHIDSEGYLIYMDCYTGLFDTLSPSAYCSSRNTGISITRTKFALSPAPPLPYQTAGSGILLYPDPFSSYILIQADSTVQTYQAIEAYDITGRLVLSQPLTDASLQRVPTDQLAAGMYIFSLRDDKKVTSAKMVKW
ncbi:MAG: T9SS type A sorting domain-containing protein [Bacteroidetes bacterium]|nr:T9SS type A sorting domain-containing protein [Bacteroidota bacterium]MBS1686347.1 T9SS type A sorting domain-containing protein [Bacteroidota bacterium]